MGVIVNLTPGEDANQNAVAALSYRINGSGPYLQGLPLARVNATRFVGSLFWLSPGTSYDVRVTFSDPDGAPLNGTSVNGSASTRVESSVPAPTKSYYVTSAGSGTTCSLGSPCSLSTALNQGQSGQEIVLRGGVYYRGAMSLPRSGVAGTPIVIRSYPGETAIIDGGDPHLVVANGQRLYPYQSLADLQSLAWGIPGFYASGTAVYVRLAGNANPTGATMIVSRFNNAFMVEQDYIYFVNLTFRYYGQGSYAKALYFNNASDNLVQGCTFAVNDLGVGLKRDSHRNVIQDNVFYDTDFNWPWEAVKSGSALETGGLRLYDPMTGRGTIIRRNTFHDYFDGLGVCPAATADVTNETDVYGNLVYNVGDDGLETDGQCSNVRIWRNTFHDVLMGISLAPVYVGPVYAIRNVVYRTGVGNNTYSGSAFKFNSGYDQSGPMYLFHNTSDAALPGNSGLDIKAPGSWTSIVARNNIWSGTDYAVSNANPGQPLDLDYDDLFTTLAGELAWWSNLPDRHLNTLSELQTATGLELHGLNAVPGFINAASGNYALSTASPLIDQGLIIPGINDDYVGARPDIGAYELSPSLTLSGTPADRALRLAWTVNTSLPPTSTWSLSYYSQTIGSALTLSGLISPTRAYTLTGLTNYTWYTVTLNALLNSTPFLTDTIELMPTDRLLYLSIIMRTP